MNPLLTDGVTCASGRAIRLRPLSEKDLANTLAWRNDDRSRRWFKSQEVLEMEAHKSWFERYSRNATPDCLFFAETHEGAPVGQTSVYNFDESNGRAEVGRFLSAPDLRGKGLFREALILTLDWTFENLELREVHLEVFDDNERAIRLYESVGFSRTGSRDGLIAMHMPANARTSGVDSGSRGVVQ
jgi:UDP-4-amino-4,6-dideoxy-N-acetyl-beta-L-altrosamine N-acetyltransferase